MLIAKKELNEWTHVILDEVHEREEDMDLVMLICKKLLLTNFEAPSLCSCLPPWTITSSPSTSQSAIMNYESLRSRHSCQSGTNKIMRKKFLSTIGINARCF